MDVNTQMLDALLEGHLEEVQHLINKYGLNYSEEWLNGYKLVGHALDVNRPDIARLILNYSKSNQNVINRSLFIIFINNRNNGKAIHLAVEKDYLEIVVMILDKYPTIVNVADEYGNTPLHIAAMRRKDIIVDILLSHQANVNIQNNEGKTPLHIALLYVDTSIITKLLESNAQVNLKDDDGNTALHYAADVCGSKVIASILAKNPEIDARNVNDETALHIALQCYNEGAIQLLLNHGSGISSDVNTNRDKSPTYCAVCFNKKRIVDMLKRSSTKIDRNLKNCLTCLHIAANKNDVLIVNQLIKSGASVNAISTEGLMPIHLAASKSHTVILELLLQNGAQVDAQDRYGNTALFYAIDKANIRLVNIILKYNPDVNKRYNQICFKLSMCDTREESKLITQTLLKYGFSAAREDTNNPHFFFEAIHKGLISVIKDLSKLNANIEMELIEKSTPLHTAIKCTKWDIVELLLNLGSNVNVRDENGRTPIMSAVQLSNLKMVKLLSDHGAVFNKADNDGWTELFYIIHAKNDNTEMAEFILSKGVDINHRNNNGETPLHLAIAKSNKTFVEVLIKHGADVNIVANNDGRTPLHYAVDWRKDERIIDLLVSKGADINARNVYGLTPLHIAAKKRYVRIVGALLENCADFNVANRKNKTAAQLIVDNWMSDLLEKHVIKLHYSNQNINDIYKYLINDSTILYQNKCLKEIIKMKSENVGDTNITFYDILFKSIHSVAISLRNNNIVKCLESDDYKINLPLFNGIIKSRFRKGMERKLLLDRLDMMQHVIFNNLPYECVYIIISYLSNDELRELVNI